MGRLFGTDGVRGKANEALTAELALSLSVAAAHVLSETGEFSGHPPFAVVGRDPEELAHVLRPRQLCRRRQALRLLLGMPLSDDGHLRRRAVQLEQRVGQHADRAREGLADEEVARPCVLKGVLDQKDGLVEGHQEPRHLGVGES